jgi:hypothetical protein
LPIAASIAEQNRYLDGCSPQQPVRADERSNDARPRSDARPNPLAAQRRGVTEWFGNASRHDAAKVARLAAEAVLVQRSDGCYDQTAIRLRYIKHPAHLAPAHNAEHAAAKIEILKLRLMERRGQRYLQSGVEALIDKIAGITLIAFSSMRALIPVIL